MESLISYSDSYITEFVAIVFLELIGLISRMPCKNTR